PPTRQYSGPSVDTSGRAADAHQVAWGSIWRLLPNAEPLRPSASSGTAKIPNVDAHRHRTAAVEGFPDTPRSRGQAVSVPRTSIRGNRAHATRPAATSGCVVNARWPWDSPSSRHRPVRFVNAHLNRRRRPLAQPAARLAPLGTPFRSDRSE